MPYKQENKENIYDFIHRWAKNKRDYGVEKHEIAPVSLKTSEAGAFLYSVSNGGFFIICLFVFCRFIRIFFRLVKNRFWPCHLWFLMWPSRVFHRVIFRFWSHHLGFLMTTTCILLNFNAPCSKNRLSFFSRMKVWVEGLLSKGFLSKTAMPSKS